MHGFNNFSLKHKRMQRHEQNHSFLDISGHHTHIKAQINLHSTESEISCFKTGKSPGRKIGRVKCVFALL